jgi:NAD(P)-dependent dehydrogenase (short-subunit alcohol dehydrogenase family)
LVTGGSRGLGLQMVRAFAKRGADVVISSRKLDACEAAAEEMRRLPPRLDLELVLQHREAGGAVGGRHQDLAVEYRRRRLDVPGVVADFLEAVRPIVAATGEDLDGLVGQMDLDPVAVELDSWIQRDPDGTFAIEDARAGSTKPGNGALTPIGWGFLR